MFKKGTYYIGDLGYVFNQKSWDEVMELTFPNYQNSNNVVQVEGELYLKDGRQFAIFGTAHGDGGYPLYERKSYPSLYGEPTYSRWKNIEGVGVDSGSIGCMRIEDLDMSEDSFYGYEVNLNDFSPYSKGGDMYFGDIRVNTKIYC